STKTGAAVREYIRENALIDAVISLPIETFMSTAAQIPTSIVVLRKKKPGDIQEKTFMAKASNVGRKPNGEPCDGSELHQIVDRYRLFKKEKSLSGSNRTGFLISPSFTYLTSRLDFDAFCKVDSFYILFNDHIKSLLLVISNFYTPLEEIRTLSS